MKNMILALTNIGLYFENYGLKYEDTFLVGSEDPTILTSLE